MKEERVKVRAARADFAEIANRVRYQQARVVVTNHGQPVLAMVSIEDLRRLQKLDVYTPREDSQLSTA